ncbi:hypothetical protein BOTBODRAFT_143431 [Botryobasidium botryosum FD-172 SS1]|uniref:Transmembrane protein n=1 Tax=Botryobasidium botryosum (strain FD-172 SS1) TaxID=930990 RepID=A0A067N3T4_BOTB1|nr:hypothetical protein BOTBODRAFT_143431 [Botryobasidium botryosum FD-172 SS1]
MRSFEFLPTISFTVYLTFLVLLLGPGPGGFVRAQNVTGPTTTAVCQSGFDWMSNSKGQSPCLIAAYLGSACISSGEFTVSGLTGPGNQYAEPTSTSYTECKCNTVYYDILSACAICQAGLADLWSDWILQCPKSMVLVGQFPYTPPTEVPAYAYYDPTSSNRFNVTAAQEIMTAKPKSSVPIGAIVGGVIGGIAVLAAFGGGIFWLVRRNRATKHKAPSQDFYPPLVQYQPPPFTPAVNAYPAPGVNQFNQINQSNQGGYSGPGVHTNQVGLQQGVDPRMSQFQPQMFAPPQAAQAPPIQYNPDDPSTFPVTPAPSNPTPPAHAYAPLPSTPQTTHTPLGPQYTGYSNPNPNYGGYSGQPGQAV